MTAQSAQNLFLLVSSVFRCPAYSHHSPTPPPSQGCTSKDLCLMHVCVYIADQAGLGGQRTSAFRRQRCFQPCKCTANVWPSRTSTAICCLLSLSKQSCSARHGCSSPRHICGCKQPCSGGITSGARPCRWHAREHARGPASCSLSRSIRAGGHSL